MDMFFSQLSDSVDQPQSSLLSDASVTTRGASCSDGDVILASSRPKKRAGRRVFKETRHPVYRGVRRRNNDKWVCEMREPNKKKSRIWLGTYPTAEMAARAHDVAALAFRGKLACINFADSAWRLPVPASMDTMDIRRAAAEAAEGFRPVEFGGVCSGSSDEKERMVVQVEEKNKKGSVNLERSRSLSLSYWDEEEVFHMPRLLHDMAEGLLLSPSQCLGGYMNLDDMGTDADVKLWSFSI
ncbi:dehydration-responsive element-binding protein 1F-like [Prunus avium]|uniref:Dehydration responsive element binding protein 1 n=1 Tax=Prunus avium TaxID=42229 RepID=Q8H9A1_PRUAV|nr:dehydration-responsive element-binding protein 1F-like [Prunus avium]BAC20184.1 dehydration responsive element binding protein 1 like protein [Prunus avium]BAD27123.1 dehydration responsive element binding protein 1 [Prunus avium]